MNFLSNAMAMAKVAAEKGVKIYFVQFVDLKFQFFDLLNAYRPTV